MKKWAGRVLRSGFIVAAFWATGFWSDEAEAQLLRGRGTRGSVQASQPSNSGWRGVQPRELDFESITPPSPASTSVNSTEPGLGEIIRPADNNLFPPTSPTPAVTGRAGTPVPEHYYRQDWRRDPAAWGGTANYPKYFGGFHSSHYYDLGIPNGDKGFRGNGIYWTPW